MATYTALENYLDLYGVVTCTFIFKNMLTKSRYSVLSPEISKSTELLSSTQFAGQILTKAPLILNEWIGCVSNRLNTSFCYYENLSCLTFRCVFGMALFSSCCLFLLLLTKHFMTLTAASTADFSSITSCKKVVPTCNKLLCQGCPLWNLYTVSSACSINRSEQHYLKLDFLKYSVNASVLPWWGTIVKWAWCMRSSTYKFLKMQLNKNFPAFKPYCSAKINTNSNFWLCENAVCYMVILNFCKYICNYVAKHQASITIS